MTLVCLILFFRNQIYIGLGVHCKTILLETSLNWLTVKIQMLFRDYYLGTIIILRDH